MFGDRERPERQRAEQDRALSTHLRQEVVPYSPFHQRRLAKTQVAGVAELGRLPTMRLDDVKDPADLVLRPTAEQIAASGSFDLKSRLAAAKLFGKVAALNRSVIDPLYKPVHWVLAGSIPVAYSARDLDRLGEIGRRWLESAGVQISDTIVSLLPPGPNLAYWQLLMGGRVGGLSAIGLNPGTPAADIVALQPTVLAGTMSGLARLAGEGAPAMPDVRTILAIGDPADPRLGAIARLSGRRDVAVVSAYAPAGVRALWAQCRGGAGLHTWPATEVIELDPEPRGEIIWTGTGWYGSAFVRLRTGVSGALVEGTCPACGRTTPRLVGLAALPAGGAQPPASVPKATPAPKQAPPPKATPAPKQAPPPKAEPVAKPRPAPPPKVAPPPVPLPAPAPAPAPKPVSAPVEVYEEDLPDFDVVLGDNPEVAAWQVELRTVGRDDELIVFLAVAGGGHPGRLVRALDREIDATQYVVLDVDSVRQRIRRCQGEQVVDVRT